MQSIKYDLFNNPIPVLCSGKTSLVSSTPKITPSGAFWGPLQAKMKLLPHGGGAGQTLALLLDVKEQLRGEFSTLNFSERPNVVVESTLSQALEPTSIQHKYFSSLQLTKLHNWKKEIISRCSRRKEVDLALRDYVNVYLTETASDI